MSVPLGDDRVVGEKDGVGSALWSVFNFTNILGAHFALIFFQQKSLSQTVIRENLCKTLLYQKVV